MQCLYNDGLCWARDPALGYVQTPRGADFRTNIIPKRLILPCIFLAWKGKAAQYQSYELSLSWSVGSTSTCVGKDRTALALLLSPVWSPCLGLSRTDSKVRRTGGGKSEASSALGCCLYFPQGGTAQRAPGHPKGTVLQDPRRLHRELRRGFLQQKNILLSDWGEQGHIRRTQRGKRKTAPLMARRTLHAVSLHLRYPHGIAQVWCSHTKPNQYNSEELCSNLLL